jgi:chromosome segregation ATPase
MEESARRSVELADRLRIKVVDLEASLQTVVSEMNEAAAAQIRADEAETALAAAEEARALTMADTDRAADAEGRLGELEERLAALDSRIARSRRHRGRHPRRGSGGRGGRRRRGG